MSFVGGARTLNRLPMVEWDRFIEHDDYRYVYGWIRTSPVDVVEVETPNGTVAYDTRADFVLLMLDRSGDAVWGLTSSSEHSRAVGDVISGEADGPHIDCQRVEAEIPGVRNVSRSGTD